MLNRILLPALLLFAPARAEDAFDPASIMPAETIAYAEFDAAALQRGFTSLDLVRVLFAEEYAGFFGPILGQIPVEDLKTMKPVRDWVRGHAAVGLSGLTVRLRGLDGTYRAVRFAAGEKIDPAFFNLLFVAELTGGGPSMILDFEGVAVVEPGEALRKWFDGFLADPPVPFTQKFVQRGAHQILTLKFEPFREEGVWYAPELHLDVTGDRWLIATSADLLAKATAPRAPLAADPEFVRTRDRHTSGERVAFLYGDCARALEVAGPLVPALVQDAMALNGIASVRNLAVGYSIVDGGVRESLGVGLTKDPGGFWKLLDAFPPGIRSIHKLPPRALGVIALKLDPKLFDQRMQEVFGSLLPGIEKQVRDASVAAAMQVGINYDTELVPAFGDELAIAFFPTGGLTPDMLFGIELRDERAFGVLMEKLEALSRNSPVPLTRTEEGWKLGGPLPARIRVHEKHLLASTNPAILRRTIADWAAPEKTIAKDAEIFTRVIRGLNGGETDSLVALAYGDIRQWLPPLLAMGASTGVLDEIGLNPKPMPDIRKLANNFSGLAIGLRRDEAGIALESFGPLGGLTAMGGAPVFFFARAAEAPIRVAPAR